MNDAARTLLKRGWPWLVVAAALVFAGCSPATAPAAPTEPATLAPTPPPAQTPTAAPSCPEPAAGTVLLRQDALGFCTLYPEGVQEIVGPPDQVCLVPEGPAVQCHSAVAFFNVTDAGGRSAAEVVDERMTQEGGFGPERESVTIGGVEAVVLPNVGGQATTRQVIFVYENRLYTIAFVLPDPDDAEGIERHERLYEVVIGSFTLVPATTTSSAVDAALTESVPRTLLS